MKKISLIVLGVGVGIAVGWVVASKRLNDELSRQRLAWESETAQLKAKIDELTRRPAEPAAISSKIEVVQVKEQADPREILARLQRIRISSGAGQTKNARLAIQHFEMLIALGPGSLPAIREFLLRNEEIDYDSSLSPRGSRDGRISTEFALPPSLRFGLFDVARQIGGPDAEKLLADVLAMTGRGAEVAYLARVLEDIAPGRYRELCLTTARELLATHATAGGPGLDKYDREYLYGVLALFGDNTFAAEAQTHLVRADGLVDRGALKYLQQTIGAAAMPAIAQTYQNSSLDPAKKEPLARYALAFTGIDPHATEFLHNAYRDPQLPVDQRAELIEDFNQDGIQSEENPTDRDAILIRARLELLDRWNHESNEPAVLAAFDEARKDLVNMLKKYNGRSIASGK